MQNQRITSNSMSTNQAHLVNTGTLTHADLNNQIQRAERIAACMPAKLPFPKSRLDQGHLLRTHTGRDQFACGEGSFVLTNIALLPSGGQKKRIDIATPELNTLFVGDMGTPSPGRGARLALPVAVREPRCARPE